MLIGAPSALCVRTGASGLARLLSHHRRRARRGAPRHRRAWVAPTRRAGQGAVGGTATVSCMDESSGWAILKLCSTPCAVLSARPCSSDAADWCLQSDGVCNPIAPLQEYSLSDPSDAIRHYTPDAGPGQYYGEPVNTEEVSEVWQQLRHCLWTIWAGLSYLGADVSATSACSSPEHT